MAFEYILSLSLVLNIVSVLSLTVLLFSNFTRIFKTGKEEKRLIRETMDKSNITLNKAVKQANKIITWAELKGLRLFSKEKLDIEKITNDYQERVAKLENATAENFEKNTAMTEATYKDFLERIESSLAVYVSKNQSDMKIQAEKFVTDSKKMLDTFLTDMRSEVKKQVSDEMALVKKEIEAYKERRMKLLDENVIDILEQTVALALGKKLTLSDQSELIYKALEEAKKERALD